MLSVEREGEKERENLFIFEKNKLNTYARDSEITIGFQKNSVG